MFDEAALADLAFIAKARSAGLSLADVRRLLRDRAKGKMAFRKAAAEVYGVQAARLEAARQALAALSSELTGEAHLAA